MLFSRQSEVGKWKFEQNLKNQHQLSIYKLNIKPTTHIERDYKENELPSEGLI